MKLNLSSILYLRPFSIRLDGMDPAHKYMKLHLDRNHLVFHLFDSSAPLRGLQDATINHRTNP